MINYTQISVVTFYMRFIRPLFLVKNLVPPTNFALVNSETNFSYWSDYPLFSHSDSSEKNKFQAGIKKHDLRMTMKDVAVRVHWLWAASSVAMRWLRTTERTKLWPARRSQSCAWACVSSCRGLSLIRIRTSPGWRPASSARLPRATFWKKFTKIGYLILVDYRPSNVQRKMNIARENAKIGGRLYSAGIFGNSRGRCTLLLEIIIDWSKVSNLCVQRYS